MSRHVATKHLSMYLDEEVPTAEAVRIESHLEACAECRARLDGLRRVVGRLQGLESAAPPGSIGLELQRRLARTTPAFGEPSPFARSGSKRVMQPVVLASLGVVLALAIITLLFLQALHSREGEASGAPGDAASGTIETVEVVVFGRAFRSGAGGWVEASLTMREIAGARELPRAEALAAPPSEQERLVLSELTGAVTLRWGEEVVRVGAE